MSKYLLLALCLLPILLSGKKKASRVIYLKKSALTILSFSFIICLILFSKSSVNSALKGIKLWLEIVFPSLFPFFVGSEILNRTGFVKALGILLEPVMRPLFNVPGCGSFAFAMGITSGYPVGAKITSEMRKSKLLTKDEAERLLTFTNNSGPLFIIGAVSVGMFKIHEAGLLLLCCHILSGMTVGMIFKYHGWKKKSSKQQIEGKIIKRFIDELKANQGSLNLGNIFGEAVKNSINLILAIGGFIIFFSVVINLLLETGFINSISNVLSSVLMPLGFNKNLIASIISGFFEITTGTNMASQAAGASLVQKLTSASVIIGWAGLSVHSQVLSIISSTDISIKPYLAGKLLHGLISGLYTYLYIKIANPSFISINTVFSQYRPLPYLDWQDYAILSLKYLSYATFVLLAAGLASFLVYCFKKRRMHKSNKK